MKELTIEQKAQRYDEALERYKAKQEYESQKVHEFIEYLFPELNEDERIRKDMIETIKKEAKDFPSSIIAEKSNIWLAWLEKQGEHANFRNKIQIGDKVTRNKDGVLVNLSQLKRVAKKDEKQGEQKFADNVEPKFKVGDWVIDKQGIVHQISNVIENVTNHTYGYDIVGGGYFNDNTEGVRLWTIQDAKDGDVLAYNDGSLTIFRYRLSGLDAGLYMSHILLTDKIEFKQTCAINNVHPATKEQRDTLMKAIADAGYTFDFENKELKKVEQKPAWSEEDESYYNSALCHIKYSCGKEGIVYNWLKSLKDRVQPQREWSEEDEAMYQGVIETEQYMLEVVNGRKIFDVGNVSIMGECAKELTWLNSRFKKLQARKAVEIARKEMIEKVCEWLDNNVFRYVDREEEIGFPMYHTTECIEDLKKHLEDKV